MKLALCGSLKFEDLFHSWNKSLTLIGHVVYSVSVFPSIVGEKNWYDETEKVTLDLVHLEKIANSEGIVVLNKDGYVGQSTAREIAYATMLGRQIFWLEANPNDQRTVLELLTGPYPDAF